LCANTKIPSSDVPGIAILIADATLQAEIDSEN